MKFRAFSLLAGLGILGPAACFKANKDGTSAVPGPVLYVASNLGTGHGVLAYRPPSAGTLAALNRNPCATSGRGFTKL